ncbi:MAG: hypothetical protein IPG45_28020 [Deltaproteobacteria bacterium]|nr:hypothetical protein [Deltaproteobacteria bacterium]
MAVIDQSRKAQGIGYPVRSSTLWSVSHAASILVFTCLVVATLGEFSRFFGSVSLITSFVGLVGGAVGALLAPIAILRRSYQFALRMLVTAAGAVAALLITQEVVFGTPIWVTLQARPAIDAVVRYAGAGPYPQNDPKFMPFSGEPALPPDVAAVVRSTGCSYSGYSDPPTFHITCEGVLFAMHTYDYRTDSWSTWD